MTHLFGMDTEGTLVPASSEEYRNSNIFVGTDLNCL